MDRLTGVVKWFDNTKGFGFIESQGTDYFVHFRAIKNMGFKTLTEGQKVMFDPKKTDKGLTADNVTVGVSDGNV